MLNERDKELQDVVDMVAGVVETWITEWYPDVDELNCAEWRDVWYKASQPFEMLVRQALRKRGMKIEKWILLED